jgi:uncharacterized protein (TIGR02246 family)
MRKLLILAAALAAAAPLAARGDEKSALAKADEKAIQKLEDAYVSAYNRGDAKGLAALFTKDATIVNSAGGVLTGRAELEKGLKQAFAGPAKGAKLVNTPLSTRAVSKGVVVTHGTARTTGGGDSKEAHTFTYTKVLVRQGKQWRVAAAQFAVPTSPPSEDR